MTLNRDCRVVLILTGIALLLCLAFPWQPISRSASYDWYWGIGGFWTAYRVLWTRVLLQMAVIGGAGGLLAFILATSPPKKG